MELAKGRSIGSIALLPGRFQENTADKAGGHAAFNGSSLPLKYTGGPCGDSAGSEGPYIILLFKSYYT